MLLNPLHFASKSEIFCRIFAVSALFLAPLAVEAQAYAPPLSGWTHSGTWNRDTPQKHGVSLVGDDVTYSAPVIAEIDGDTSNGKEVAIGSADGVLQVYRANGSLLWSSTTPNYSCGTTSNNKLLSSPAVGAIFGDGMPYVVVGYGGFGGKACGGGVVAFRGNDGTQTWHFDLKKFAKKQKFYSISHAVLSSPALADTDFDGKMEIAFGSFDRNVYLLNSNGSLRWYYQAADTVWSSPAFANINSDPNLELIIGTDISQNKKLRPPTQNGGYVYAFKTKAVSSKSKKIGFRQKGGYIWQSSFNQVIYSSPVIADVLPSSPGEEVIVGSGCYFPERTNKKRGGWIKVMRLSTGRVLATLNTGVCSSSHVAVGDIDGDGVLEVVATVRGSTSVGGDGTGRVMAWKVPNPSAPLWSVAPKVKGQNDDDMGDLKSPVIADLDGNGSLEVVVGNESGVSILQGRTGASLSCETSSCVSQIMLPVSAKIRSTPAIGDVNLDGKLDLVFASGAAFALTDFAGILNSEAGVSPAYATPWPMSRGNPRHTAHFGD